MDITQEQAHRLQNLGVTSALVTEGGRWAEILLFKGGETVVLEGETRSEGSPSTVEEASIGVGYSCFEPLSVVGYEALVAKYSSTPDEDRYASLRPIPGEGLYVDFDEEYDTWAVFGDRSGFCYGQYPTEEAAASSLVDGG